MSELLTQTPNAQTSKKVKAAAALTAVALAGAMGLSAKRGTSAVNSFKTNIPVPTEVQPHIDYPVKAGDTEGSIAAQFGHANDLDYENMINSQLSKDNQSMRNLHPGDQLNLPPK
ncbi:LysM peptidoglycan-binding domain-containing protein [Candidatus Saccharibacteria bacterium]|nr:LysM peptidoglycan-binding domain-containing protein [Candidatus Saccharibacteria bacterium]